MKKAWPCGQQIVRGAAILASVLLGGCCLFKANGEISGVGGGIGSSGSHQTKLSGGACSSPAVHVLTTGPNYQSVAKTDPKFCWDTMGSITSDWKFDLYTSTNQAVGCSSGSSFVPTSTISVQCTGVSLTANNLYKGILQYHYQDGTGPYNDTHWYKAQ
jgi:hypothetical protein